MSVKFTQFLLLAPALFLGLLLSCSESSPPSAKKPDILEGHSQHPFGKIAFQHTERLLAFGPRPAGSAGLTQVRGYIQQELKKHGWICIEQTFTQDTPKGKITFTNLIARHQKNEEPSIWQSGVNGILGAHIDSKHIPNFIGADDAASAVGAILSIAEFLHQHHPALANDLEIVFFDGEEAMNTSIQPGIDGLYGSFYYARAVQRYVAEKKAPYPHLPHYAIILDMIGHQDLKIRIPSDTPPILRQHYNDARKKLGTTKHFQYADSPIIDDHLPLDKIARIPSIDIIGDFTRDGWWHTPDDSIDLISTDSLQKSIHLTLEMLSSLR